MEIRISFGEPKQLLEVISLLAPLGETLKVLKSLEFKMSKFVDDYNVAFAELAAKVTDIDTVVDSVAALVKGQTDHINVLLQQALDAPTLEETNAIIAGIQEVTAQIATSAKTLAAIVPANVPVDVPVA
jgi:hypothetical protein